MKSTIKQILISLVITLTLGQTVVIAATPIIPKPQFIPGPTEDYQKEKSGKRILVDRLLPSVASSLTAFVAALSFVMLVVAGVRFATAYGNEEAQNKARNQTIYALVGLIISLLAYSIVTIIINLQLE